MSVDRMKQLQRNTVTNADVIDGALVLKRYDGSKVTVETGIGEDGIHLHTADGLNYLQIQDNGGAILAVTDSFNVNVDDGAGTSNHMTVRTDLARLSSSSPSADAWVAVKSDVEIRVGEAGHNLIIINLPTADPHVAGAVWNNAGSLKISAG